MRRGEARKLGPGLADWSEQHQRKTTGRGVKTGSTKRKFKGGDPALDSQLGLVTTGDGQWHPALRAWHRRLRGRIWGRLGGWSAGLLAGTGHLGQYFRAQVLPDSWSASSSSRDWTQFQPDLASVERIQGSLKCLHSYSRASYQRIDGSQSSRPQASSPGRQVTGWPGRLVRPIQCSLHVAQGVISRSAGSGGPP